MKSNEAPDTRSKHAILKVEGIVVHAKQVPDKVELIVVDEEVYTEPMLEYTREDLAPYEGMRDLRMRQKGARRWCEAKPLGR